MKIYTGFGDRGKTSLFGGEVVMKNHLRVSTYGALDELNSWLGVLMSGENDADLNNVLMQIQDDIFDISSHIATPDNKQLAQHLKPLRDNMVAQLENLIDKYDRELPEIKNFILPGGALQSAFYHVSRTVCRRAERELTALMEVEKVNENIIVYFNRLSDLLFVLARYKNHMEGINDTIWNNK